MKGSIPGLYPLDANSGPQVGATILTLSLLLTIPLSFSHTISPNSQIILMRIHPKCPTLHFSPHQKKKPIKVNKAHKKNKNKNTWTKKKRILGPKSDGIYLISLNS